MQLAEIKNIYHQELSEIYPKEEIDSFFYQSVEFFLKLERFVLVMHPNFTLTKIEEQPLFETLTRLKQEEPLQYILGESYFMDLTIKLNEHTLIPRPETEELVQWILSEIPNQKSEIRILDIGTGSGCIAIALAKALPNAKVYALDISKEAIHVATTNAQLNRVSVEFFQADILDFDVNLTFDIIISNPPYIRQLEKEEIQNNVKRYEPEMALFVPDDNPLVFYNAIVQFSKKRLHRQGSIYFEINQYLANESKELLIEHGFKEVFLKKDIFDNYRMLKGIMI